MSTIVQHAARGATGIAAIFSASGHDEERAA